MCGGNLPSRPDSADLIAIIHPSQHSSSCSSRSKSLFSGRLMLSNRYAEVTTSEFSQVEEGYDGTGEPQMLHVRIHKYGQPLRDDFAPAVDKPDINPILHSFLTGNCARSMLNSRLDLGVGGEGLVGRTISITDGNQKLLGQGIIGRI